MKCKVTVEDKVRQVLEYITSETTLQEAGAKIGVTEPELHQWVTKYRLYGLNSLYPKIHEAMVPEEERKRAVQEFNDGVPLKQLACDYRVQIRVLKKWISQYNQSNDNGGTIMSKSTVSIEKKIEIAKYCLAHDKNYVETATKYGLSYQNVYLWTKKYMTLGVEGLKDLRGKNKKATRIKQLDAEKDLEAQLAERDRRIHLLEMENDYLKKLSELSKKINLGKKTKK